MARNVLIGTSGWSYDDWADRFYEGVPRSRWLEHYARTFPTVEVNNTFYRLASEKAVRRWREQVPDDFCFVVKGSRYITHQLRLREPQQALERFFTPLAPLGEVLGTVLWQLPPTMRLDLERLDRFLSLVPASCRHAVEFRHPSWLTAEARAVLDRHGALHVNVSGPQLPQDLHVTGGAVYVRFHGLRAGYAYDYTDDDLRPWVRHLRAQRSGFAFFNNDVGGHAVANAFRLRELLAG